MTSMIIVVTNEHGIWIVGVQTILTKGKTKYKSLLTWT